MFCQLCDGSCGYMGQLGRLAWFRCQDCGMDNSIRLTFEEKSPPVEEASEAT